MGKHDKGGKPARQRSAPTSSSGTGKPNHGGCTLWLMWVLGMVLCVAAIIYGTDWT